jgi:hypothetical protein
MKGVVLLCVVLLAAAGGGCLLRFLALDGLASARPYLNVLQHVACKTHVAGSG